MLKITATTHAEVVRISSMPNGRLAVAVNGEFKGEVFYRNVAGVHGLTADRYWPSDYIVTHGKPGAHCSYIPPFDVMLLQPGDVVTVGGDDQA